MLKRIWFKKEKKGMIGLLTNLEIGEVSFCVKGANPGAKISLFKLKKDLHSEAATFSELFIDPEVAEAKNKASNSFFDMLSTLSDSIHRIAFDPDITVKERKALMDKSMNEFTSVFKDKLRDDLTKVKGDVPMSYEDLIKLLGLKEVSPEMEKILKALVENSSNAEDTAKKLVEIQKQLEEAKKKAEEGKGNPEPPEEKDPIKKAKAEGASEAVIALLEKQKEDNEALQKKVEKGDARIDKMEESNVRKECLQTASVYKHIEAAETLSETLYELKKAVTPELYTKIEKLLEGVEKKLSESNLFKIAGKDGEGSSTDCVGIVAQIDSIAKEMHKSDPSKTIEVHKVQAWRDNPELRKSYDTAKAELVRNR